MGQSKEEDCQRVVIHDKSSLAPEGPAILFSLDEKIRFTWDRFSDITAHELLTSSREETKIQQAEQLLKTLLEGREVASEELFRRTSELGISEQTLKIAKQNLGVTAVRRDGRWYADLPLSG